MLAIELKNTEIAKYLIDSGADANAKDSRGETVLMKAERKQMPEIASLLKTKGAESAYRSQADLADDKFCAEELWKALFPPPPPIDPIKEALQRGDRLQAMSWYASKHGVSYKEAKQAIDKMIQDKKPLK
jgi:ankyrin repeat protein